MYKLLGSCLLATVLFTACNSGSGTKKSNAATTPASLPGVTTTPANNASAPVITAPSTNAATTGTTAAGTNPPHGQPGHRCDLAVGAPLNGAAAPSVTIPGNKPANNITIQPQPANTTTMPMPTNTSGGGVRNGVKLNPPHGQPGHDCSVQVGQPLKS